jgi:putrescine transport system substrate-binding protein
MEGGRLADGNLKFSFLSRESGKSVRMIIGIARTLAAAVFAALLAIPHAGAEPQRVVNFYNWSDYIDPTVLDDFTKETGIKVRYDTFDSNDTLEAKLLAGKSGYDVVVPTAYFLARQIQAGVFLTLDKAKLPNLVNAWPEITDRLARYDPGNAHAVNYMWGTTGIGYNLKAARQILGAGAEPLLGRRFRSRPDREIQGMRRPSP